MGAYEYLALTGRGREQRGVLEGDSPRHVRQQLRERGLSALEVFPLAGRATATAAATSHDRVPSNELVVATRQLATLARAGLPISEVLGTVAEQSARPATRRARCVRSICRLPGWMGMRITRMCWRSLIKTAAAIWKRPNCALIVKKRKLSSPNV